MVLAKGTTIKMKFKVSLANFKEYWIMGCSNSKVDVAIPPPDTNPPPPPAGDPRLPLNPREVFRLQKSWKGIKRRMEETGVELFVGQVKLCYRFILISRIFLVKLFILIH